MREADRKEDKRSRHWRDMHNLIKTAPQFDGTGDVEFWLHEVALYLKHYDVYDDSTQNRVIIGAMTGSAREWFGSLDFDELDRNSKEEVIAAIIARYGKSKMWKIRNFNEMKQKTGEKLQAYADRLRKACYGLNKDPEEIIYKFYGSISVSSQVIDDVVNLPCTTLQQAVEYVEKHSKGGSSGGYDKSQMRCSICKRTGHTSKTCRSKARTSNQRTKKMDVLEELDEQEACAAYEDESDYGAPEDALVACYSEDDEQVVDLFNFGADVEDLGKRKGTNPARDDLVKKLRDTPPNANTSQGGFRSVPVQPMAGSDYKTYRTKRDKYAAVKKEAKETMRKPVAVPLNQYIGLQFLASKD